MAATGTDLIIAAGAITAANEALFAPIAQGGSNNAAKDFNWRIIPATAIMAVFVAGLDKLNPKLATGVGLLALIAVTIAPVGKASSPIVNLSKIAGTGKK